MSNNVPKGYTRLEPKPINELGKEFQPQEVQAHMMRYTTHPPPNLAVSPFERLTQCMVTGAVKDIILATPGYPMQPAQPKSRAYRIAPSPGAGLGMFATRPLAEGDLIVSERAILIVPAMMQAMQPNIDSLGLTDAEKRAITIHSGETQLRDAFNRMIPVEQANYMALADSAQRQEGGNWPPLSGRLHTNAYGLNNLRNPGVDGAHGIYAGVFNELSRINHSCRPNCLRRFHLPSFSMRIYTVRDIAVGEEITLNYNAEWMTADRQKSLQGYGFQCRCPSCLDAKASDQRRVIIEREYSCQWDAVKKGFCPTSPSDVGRHQCS